MEKLNDGYLFDKDKAPEQAVELKDYEPQGKVIAVLEVDAWGDMLRLQVPREARDRRVRITMELL